MFDVIGSIIISLSHCCLPNHEGPAPNIFFLELPLVLIPAKFRREVLRECRTSCLAGELAAALLGASRIDVGQGRTAHVDHGGPTSSVCGKTIEQLRKRIYIKLISDPNEAKRFIRKPTCNSFHIISDDLTMVHLGKRKITMNKPIFACMVISPPKFFFGGGAPKGLHKLDIMTRYHL